MTCFGTTILQVHRVGVQMDLQCFNYNLVHAPRCECCQARWDSPMRHRVTQSVQQLLLAYTNINPLSHFCGFDWP